MIGGPENLEKEVEKDRRTGEEEDAEASGEA